MEFCVDGGVLWDFRDDECDRHTRIAVPHGVRVIGEAAFADNEFLYHVALPKTVERIERDAFYNCYSLSWVLIPDGVTYIGPYAFADCPSLGSISIPESVTEIDPSAFWLHKEWDEYLTGGPFYICGRRGSVAERFAREHPFVFREIAADERG